MPRSALAVVPQFTEPTLPATIAPADDGVVAITEYPLEYLVCRSIGHRWPDPRTWHWRKVIGHHGRVLHYRRTMMCERCHKIGWNDLHPDGDRDPRRYRDPAGYARPGTDRSEVTVELLRRLVPVDVEVITEAQAAIVIEEDA